jgi:hypothetical protein
MMFSGITTHRECQARIITLMIGECSLKINNIIKEKTERERASVFFRFDTTDIGAALLHGSKLLASFPIFYEADNAIAAFWHQLFDVVPHLKQCSILSCKPRDNAIIKTFLQDHTTSEVCYFHSQQQAFIEYVRQDKQEEQETLQETLQDTLQEPIQGNK